MKLTRPHPFGRHARTLGLSASLMLSMACPALADNPGDAIEHQFVVRLSPGQAIEDVTASYNALVIGSYPSGQLYLLQSSGELNDADQAVEFELDDRIEHSEQNLQNAVAEGHTQSFFVRTAQAAYSPQPVVGMLALSRVHTLSTGVGITIAVLDTGVSPHPLLASHLRADGFNFIDENTDTADIGTGAMAGHGTFVSGIVHLVATDADILPVKVLDSTGFGTSFTIAAGILYAVEHGANVINLSLSTPEDSGAVASAVAHARAAGVILVGATQNTRNDDLMYPAANTGVIAVAATDMQDHLAQFSGYGRYISLCAPGTNVVGPLPGNDYGMSSGTSAASALVAGCVAVVRSRFPSMTSAQIEQRLMSSALDIDTRNPDLEGDLGSGRVRPYQALVRTKLGLDSIGPR